MVLMSCPCNDSGFCVLFVKKCRGKTQIKTGMVGDSNRHGAHVASPGNAVYDLSHKIRNDLFNMIMFPMREC